jgi:hypothetical protein
MTWRSIGRLAGVGSWLGRAREGGETARADVGVRKKESFSLLFHGFLSVSPVPCTTRSTSCLKDPEVQIILNRWANVPKLYVLGKRKNTDLSYFFSQRTLVKKHTEIEGKKCDFIDATVQPYIVSKQVCLHVGYKVRIPSKRHSASSGCLAFGQC